MRRASPPARRPALAPALAALLLAAGALAHIPHASAQQQVASSDVEERRNRLFREGKAAADAGRWAEAADRFRQVVALRTAPKALIALGVAEERLGHLVAAQAAYKQAREDAADKALTDDLKTANSALESIRPRVPTLVFTPEGVLAGASVELDGAPQAPVTGPLPADPGERTLVATSPGKGTFRVTLTLREGERRDVPVVFGASGPSPTATSTASRPDAYRDVSPPVGALALGGAGVLLLAVGGAMYGVGSSQYAESDGLCPGVTCTPDVAAKGNDGRSQMIIGDALLVVGAAATAVAGIYWVVSATSKKSPSRTSVLLAPTPAGLTVRGTF